MNAFKYKSILYFISLVIIATLCIQVYWNYKNYQVGKQQLLNDVQTSLDNAVDTYFTELATDSPFKNTDMRFGERQSFEYGKDTLIVDSIFTLQRMQNKFPEGMTILRSFSSDSIDMNVTFSDSAFIHKGVDPIFEFIQSSDNPITELSSKIIISIAEDKLSLPKVDSLFASELNRKSINVNYGLSYEDRLEHNDSLRPSIISEATLQTTSKSPYFFNKNVVKAHFTNITLAVLQKNLLGIFLSFLLVGSVIVCLLYLLRIIRQQKQLAEVKNDLINNITHEFKTPIATIGIAMEAIQNFNAPNDSEKNLRYAKISSEQVAKLNVMVEKLLETATLDSEQLHLNFESHELVELLRRASQKEAIAMGEKQISFTTSEEELYYSMDRFHFENAINNIIDNAIKYGGDIISLAINRNDAGIEIIISDSGNSLSEVQKKQLFEKFYRVPKGNTHDVKGFGIGLYYAKKIVERHGGTISVEIRPNTQFIINLPNG